MVPNMKLFSFARVLLLIGAALVLTLQTSAAQVCTPRCPPIAPGTEGLCVELCTSASVSRQQSCPSGKLCCSNGCGHVCMTAICG